MNAFCFYNQKTSVWVGVMWFWCVQYKGRGLQEHALPRMNKPSQSQLLLQWSLQKAETVSKERIKLSSALSRWLRFLAGLLCRTLHVPEQRPSALQPCSAQPWSLQPWLPSPHVQNEAIFLFFLFLFFFFWGIGKAVENMLQNEAKNFSQRTFLQTPQGARRF